MWDVVEVDESVRVPKDETDQLANWAPQIPSLARALVPCQGQQPLLLLGVGSWFFVDFDGTESTV